MGLARFARLFNALSKATHPGRHPARLSLRLCVRLFFLLCGSAALRAKFLTAQTQKNRHFLSSEAASSVGGFSDGYGPGAVRELEKVYGGTVTVSS